jgi:hypothetical protein
MPRDRMYNTARKQTQIRLLPSVMRRIEKERKRRDISKNLVIEKAIERGLPLLEEEAV